MNIQRWEIPSVVIEQTQEAFRCGEHEVFVIWTAPLEEAGPICHVRHCVVPEQTPGFSPEGGAYVHITGAELSRIQFANYDRKERSMIQLHTHPSHNVRMSALDRKWEVVNHVGALSIIVPWYGKSALMGFSGVNVYEREHSDWRLWPPEETARRLIVV